jgi:hypothetical protein
MVQEEARDGGCTFEFDLGGEVGTAPHQNLAVYGELQEVGEPADVVLGGTSRRSGRRRAAKNLGKEWFGQVDQVRGSSNIVCYTEDEREWNFGCWKPFSRSQMIQVAALLSALCI